MTIEEYEVAVSAERNPPEYMPALLRALWLDRWGDWDAAHKIVQDISGVDAALVHAYLHRKEGDPGNARYWYQRAGMSGSNKTLEAEWRDIAEHLLACIPQ